MRPEASIYVCSKPLQYFNVLNLPRDGKYKNVLIIENKFKDAHLFYQRVVDCDKSWDEILIVEDRAKIFLYCLFRYKAINMFYYLDFMLRAATFLYFLPCKNVYVYEEGISAYRTDIFAKTAMYKRKIRKIFGLSEYAGFHPKTKGIYVYCKDKYISRFSRFRKIQDLRPLSFNVPFPIMIENNLGLARRLFHLDRDPVISAIHSKKVLLYITSWPLDPAIIERLAVDCYDYCIIKPHPHIREMEIGLEKKNILVADSLVLAEFLISVLVHQDNSIDIYHHNSSAVMYLPDEPRIINVVNLSTPLPV